MGAGTIGIIGIILGLGVLIYLAFKGWPMLPTVMIASFIVIIANGMDIWPAFSDGFATSLKNYTGSYVILFFFGSLFGSLLSKTGSAKSIAMQLLKLPFKRKGILVVVLSCAILTLGGVSLFVLVFTVYPIALVLFKEEDIPRRLFVAALGFGAATFTMDLMPGSPAVQNIIPTQYFGTDAFAAPVLSTILLIFEFAFGMWWLLMWQKKLNAKGEHFVPGPRDNMDELDINNTEGMPVFAKAITPLATVLILFFILNKVFKITTMYAVNISLLAGIMLSLLTMWKNLDNPLETLHEGAQNSIIALLNTAVVVGFGGVVQMSVGFQTIVDWAMSLRANPLISGTASVVVISAACGSASGGLVVFLNALGQEYLELALQHGIDPQVLHRIFSVGADALDSLPHTGGLITILAYTGLTHKEAYWPFFGTNSLAPLLATILGIILYLAFGIV